MKQQRFTTALLNTSAGKKERIIRWIGENLLCAIVSTIAILMIAATLLVVLATPPARALPSATDYYNNDVSEQIAKEWQRQASLEFGDIPRKPTAEELRYMKAYTAQKQERLNEVQK